LRWRSGHDASRSRPAHGLHSRKLKVMEIAAAVLFCSVVIWFVEEATGEHV
jgi:hypothetical protein